MARTNKKYKRKQQGKTDYKGRLELLKSGKTRLVIRKKNNDLIVQFVNYTNDGDKTISTTNKKDIEKAGWKFHGGNRPAAYLIGLYAGLKSRSKIKEAVLDLGLQPSIKGSRLYAALKGVLDSGIKVPHSKDIIPSEELIKGLNIAAYLKKISSDRAINEKQFSDYLKKGIKSEDFEKHFEEIKNKILVK